MKVMKSRSISLGIQQGGALVMFVLVLVLAGMATLFSVLDGSAIRIEREKKTADVLAEAKAALVGYAIKSSAVVSAGYFPNPDLGPGLNTEGSSVSSMGGADISLVGKLPWRTLGVSPLKDGSGECLWYVVSGRLKSNLKTSALNWDTQGQIDVTDGAGNIIAVNLAALVISPNQLLVPQSRALADAAFMQCGGNYDAKNYLDPYSSSNAVSGEVNYYAGSTNNRQAANTNNKRFVITKNDYYNDRLIFVTVDEIFSLISRRADFALQVTALLDDPDFKLHLQTIAISGGKGTSNINCSAISNISQKTFCNNWKEMLLLTQLPTPSTIIIDGIATTAICNRVLIFGGQKTAVQARLNSANKADPANYLEGTNFTSFTSPIATSNSFSGLSTFSANSSSADVLRCL